MCADTARTYLPISLTENRGRACPARQAASAVNVSRSHSKHGSSSSRQENKDEILSVADLTALPRFRAILLASGAPATMIETIPWMNGPHAQKVRDSLAGPANVEREPLARPRAQPVDRR